MRPSARSLIRAPFPWTMVPAHAFADAAASTAVSTPRRPAAPAPLENTPPRTGRDWAARYAGPAALGTCLHAVSIGPPSGLHTKLMTCDNGCTAGACSWWGGGGPSHARRAMQFAADRVGEAPGRDDVVDGDGQVPDDGDDRVEQPGDDQYHVAAQPGGEALGQQLDLLVARIGPDELPADRVAPEDEQERRGQDQGGAVERDRDAFDAGFAGVIGEQPGGERQKRDEQQQQQVEPHERAVGAVEVLGDRVVPEPHRP